MKHSDPFGVHRPAAVLRPPRGPVYRTAFAAAVLAILTAAATTAQLTDLDAPASSPLWWTLSDAIEPTELRFEHREPGRHQRRYDVAALAGVRGTRIEDAERVRYYIDGSQSPELVPMWLAFDVFAERLDGPAAVRDTALGLLTSYGIFAPAREKIVARAHFTLQDQRALVAEVADDQMALRRLLAAKSVHPRDQKVAAVEARDAAALARMTGVSGTRAEELLLAAQADPVGESHVAHLPQLRDELSPGDWAALRRLLLREIAPTIGAIRYDQDDQIAER